MKKLFLILLVTTLFNCSTDDVDAPVEEIQEATLLGRWNLQGFEGAVLYEFTADKRFTLYSSDGMFETLDNVDPIRGLDWSYDGDVVVVDLNFGNISRLTPEFLCGNNVIQWRTEDGEAHDVIYREGFDIETCDTID